MIDWNDAPPWANYAASDLDGLTFFYEDLPLAGDTIWWSPSASGRTKRMRNVHWKSSLERRPNSINETSCSYEHLTIEENNDSKQQLEIDFNEEGYV